ncbi:hypothetical protein H6P81_015017 [Aristolochia fimbriata]|uniref:Beta-galactosidase n=1 Tax=Aristolochia fimbriata TaxID=158543 RepID=A0AAV7E4A3_ARIFI|nr:hypothetical protein H6P81_015017 [Aristolochia fimbriata]
MGNQTPTYHLLLLLLVCSYLSSPSLATEVSSDGRAILINGERKLLISGSIHYPRSTAEMWPDLIQKAKQGGLDAIETYIFWDVHEPRYREYNFEGNLDFIRFFKNVQEAGLYGVLRIGPYVCAEWSYGGFPRWLHQMKGIELRTDNDIYKKEMETFTKLIIDMVKKENLLAPQGGPIIITQIENEYGNVQGPYGEKGKEYIKWCAKMAESQDVKVPWIMCQQSDAPPPMINTCNGFYCHRFTPTNPNTPKMWTENWTGWFKAWGGSNPTRPAEDVAYAVARFFETGGTFQNYYMYHGGTNFGRTSGGPYITTSYDYDAPLDEYGNLRQPKWGHLKRLHSALKSMEKVLVNGDNATTNFQDGVWVNKFTSNGDSGCFIVNKNNDDAKVEYEGNTYYVPGWSVSLLPDCKNEAYNTAKVYTQTSIMVPTTVVDSSKLTWEWWSERTRDMLRGKGTFSRKGLAEQLMTSGDASDYLWYMSTIKFGKADLKHKNSFLLSVNTTGHLLHAFFNKKLVGTQYGVDGKYRFVFEAPVRPRKENVVALLSATVGLANYGAYFDLSPTGIVGGPVQLIDTADASRNVSYDMSSNVWSYTTGLTGEEKKMYSDDSPLASKWRSDDIRVNKMFTWYRATFDGPAGDEPLVVDLQGLSKGQAWVNGQSIGRYWANFTAKTDCGDCDYRGEYKPERCRTLCGVPTQHLYHVPRSFLKSSGKNALVLFEEMGGSPVTVSFMKVVIGTVCGSVPEGGKLELECGGSQTITGVEFASFGDGAKGTCPEYSMGSCGAEVRDKVAGVCVGKRSCSVDASASVLGESSCGEGISKRLVVKATCN